VNIYELIFLNIEIYSPLIPLIFFFVKRSKRSGWAILLVSYLVIYFTLVFLANLPLVFPNGNFFNNNVIYVILSALTFCFFAFILEQFLPLKKFRTINRTVIIVAVLFCIANALWWEGTQIYNSHSAALTNLVLISYCLYYYKLQLQNLQTLFIEKQPSFWIVCGIFLYSAGNFFLFTMYNSLTSNYPNFARYSWYINDFLIFIMNILFAKGIQCSWRK
jgi:hypothetical protein